MVILKVNYRKIRPETNKVDIKGVLKFHIRIPLSPSLAAALGPLAYSRRSARPPSLF